MAKKRSCIFLDFSHQAQTTGCVCKWKIIKYLCWLLDLVCESLLYQPDLSQSTYSWILRYNSSFMAKRGLSLDTPLKPWTWISASLIGCEAPTDNTCLTPSSKLTPGAQRSICSIPSSSCIQSHSCPIRHRARSCTDHWSKVNPSHPHRLTLADLCREQKRTVGDAMLVKLAVALLVLSVLEQVVGSDNIDIHDSLPEKPVSQKGRLSLQNTGRK